MEEARASVNTPPHKVDGAILIVFFNWTPIFWLLINNIIVLIRWMSNTCRFSRHHDVIQVSHLCKNQTTPTILHNQECYPPSNDTLDFCGLDGKLGGNMWLRGADQLVLWVSYNEKLVQQHFSLPVTTLEKSHNQ